MATSNNSPVFQSSNIMYPQEQMLEIPRQNRRLSIGLPREVEKYENRIGLTPQAVEQLVSCGHQVIMETNAGMGANYHDKMYLESGATVVDRIAEVYECEIILKIAPLTSSEIDMLKGKQTIISALNFCTQTHDNIRKLMEKKMTAIAFEYFRDDDNLQPVLEAMSEIAGRASVLVASEYLSNVNEGKGILLGSVTGISPSEIVIIGASTAGEYAARVALGLGATVKVFDNSIHKLKVLERNLGQPIFTSLLQPKVLVKALHTADVVIGALNFNQETAQMCVTEEMVGGMKRGAVIVDLTIDSGTCFETTRPTTHGSPIFHKFGVVHYCVPNIASRFARTATIALSNIFAPLILRIAEVGGVNIELKENFGIRNGVYIFNGILTNKMISKRFNINSQDINLLMSAF